MPAKIALYGGSFNPIHHGHLIIARSVAEAFELDRVILLPSHTPPHKPGHRLAPASCRADMVKLAITGEPLFEFSDHDLTCAGPSYTVKTVDHFRNALPAGTELFWIIGADSLAELHTWYRVSDLVASCRIVTALRPGSETDDVPELRKLIDGPTVDQILADVARTPRIDISATDIRHRVATGRSIRYLVPDAVAHYITDTGLYQTNGDTPS
jgi:nicotinate-nucleotide adenylyltransferase